MGKKRQPTDVRDPVISFRAGEETSRWLEEAGDRHGLSRSELAKRLVVMSRHGLDTRYLASLLALAEELGEYDGFGQAVAVVYSAVRTTEERSISEEGNRLDEERRHAVIMDTISANIFIRQLSKAEESKRQKEEEEKQRIRIALPWTAY